MRTLNKRTALLAAVIGAVTALLFSGTANAATISSGHVDIFAVSYNASTNKLVLNVERYSDSTLHNPSTIDFDVHSGHAVNSASAVACKADAGTNYVLPRLESAGKIWAGWNTEDLNLAAFGGNVKIQLVSASVPTGGNLSVYDATTGTVRLHTSAACNAQTLTITESHHHPTWVFTEPGLYTLTFKASGTHNTAGAVTSDQFTYTFDVG